MFLADIAVDGLPEIIEGGFAANGIGSYPAVRDDTYQARGPDGWTRLWPTYACEMRSVSG